MSGLSVSTAQIYEALNAIPKTLDVIALAGYAEVGTYTIAARGALLATTIGDLVAGGSLTRVNNSTGAIVACGLAGTWRCMGGSYSTSSTTVSSRTQFWLRVL